MHASFYMRTHRNTHTMHTHTQWQISSGPVNRNHRRLLTIFTVAAATGNPNKTNKWSAATRHTHLDWSCDNSRMVSFRVSRRFYMVRPAAAAARLLSVRAHSSAHAHTHALIFITNSVVFVQRCVCVINQTTWS